MRRRNMLLTLEFKINTSRVFALSLSLSLLFDDDRSMTVRRPVENDDTRYLCDRFFSQIFRSDALDKPIPL